jgi:hypothetical protein
MQLRADVGATKGETTRSAVLRVVKERDDLLSCAREGAATQAVESVLQAELASLRPSGHVAEDVAAVSELLGMLASSSKYHAAISRLAELAQRTQDAEACAKMAGEDQDRLSALAAELRSSLVTAEPQRDSARHQRDMLSIQIRAIRERATKASAELRHAYRPETRDWNLVARAIRVLEEATTPTPDVPAEVQHNLSHAMTERGQDADDKKVDGGREQGGTKQRSVTVIRAIPVCGVCARAPCRCPTGSRWPCRVGCQHRDSWEPGHAERVARQSAAFNDAASPNTPETVASARGAVGLTEDSKSADDMAAEAGWRSGYDAGGEAMRAACWAAAKAVFEAEGYVFANNPAPGTLAGRMKEALKAALP